MGNLHEEDTDRSPRTRRPGDEPHHPDRHQIPDFSDRQRLQDERPFPCRQGVRPFIPQPGDHRRHRQPDQLHQREGRRNGGSSQSCQQDRERTRKGNRLPRQDRPDAGSHPLPHRQIRVGCRRPDLDIAEVQGIIIHQIVFC